jgi:hypothetical protein
LTVEYVLTTDDYIAANMCVWDRAMTLRRSRLPGAYEAVLVVVTGILGLSAVTLFFLGTAQPVPPPVVPNPYRSTFLLLSLLALVLLVIWCLAVGPGRLLRRMARWSIRRHVARELARNNALGLLRQGRRDRITLDDQSVYQDTVWQQSDGGVDIVEHKTLRVAWHKVGHVAETAEHLFVAIVGQGFLIVPLRAFTSEEHQRLFRAELGRSLREYFRLPEIERRRQEQRNTAPPEKPPDNIRPSGP